MIASSEGLPDADLMRKPAGKDMSVGVDQEPLMVRYPKLPGVAGSARKRDRSEVLASLNLFR